jgi:hypothetical protein
MGEPMAFRKLLFNRVESDAGFRVKVRSFRFFVEYREGKRVARIPVQPVIGKALVNVYANTPVAWKAPYDSEEISEEKRTEILANIVDAMLFLKYPVELVKTRAEREKI